jgi:hypothetical protein
MYWLLKGVCEMEKATHIAHYQVTTQNSLSIGLCVYCAKIPFCANEYASFKEVEDFARSLSNTIPELKGYIFTKVEKVKS